MTVSDESSSKIQQEVREYFCIRNKARPERRSLFVSKIKDYQKIVALVASLDKRL